MEQFETIQVWEFIKKWPVAEELLDGLVDFITQLVVFGPGADDVLGGTEQMFCLEYRTNG